MEIQIKVIRNIKDTFHEGMFILDNETIATFQIEDNELLKLQNANILDDTAEGVVAININIGNFKKI